MKYFLLAVGIMGLICGIWIINDRADKMAREIINACNSRYEETLKNNQAKGLNNSNNMNEKLLCRAEAYQSAKYEKVYNLGIMAGSMILASIFYLARKKSS